MNNHHLLERTYIQDAAFILHNVNNIHFTPTFAIFAITDDEELANRTDSIEATKLVRNRLDFTVIPIEDKKEKVCIFLNKTKKLPGFKEDKGLAEMTLKDFKPKNLVNAMRLAGYNFEDTTSSGKVYKACSRYYKKRKKGAEPAKPADLPSIQTKSQSKLPVIIEVETASVSTADSGCLPSISPLSSSQCSSDQSLSTS